MHEAPRQAADLVLGLVGEAQRLALLETLGILLQAPHAANDAGEQQLCGRKPPEKSDAGHDRRQRPGPSAFCVGSRLPLGEKLNLAPLHGFDLRAQGVEHGLVRDQSAGDSGRLHPSGRPRARHGRELGEPIALLDDEPIDPREPTADLGIAGGSAESIECGREQSLSLDIGLQEGAATGQPIAAHAARRFGQQGVDFVNVALNGEGQPHPRLGLGLGSARQVQGTDPGQ